MELTLISDRQWLCSPEAFLIYRDCLYQPSYPAYCRKMERVLCDRQSQIFAASLDGTPAGLIVFRLLGEQQAEIMGIAVLPGCRCRGIGSGMIREGAKKLGLHGLTAWTDNDAVDFYQQCGFRVQAELCSYPDGARVRYRCKWSQP